MKFIFSSPHTHICKTQKQNYGTTDPVAKFFNPLAGVLQPPDQTPPSKGSICGSFLQKSFHHAWVGQVKHKYSQSCPIPVDSFLPCGAESPKIRFLLYISSEQFLIQYKVACSAWAPSQLAANKSKSEDIIEKEAPLRAHSPWTGTWSCLLKAGSKSNLYATDLPGFKIHECTVQCSKPAWLQDRLVLAFSILQAVETPTRSDAVSRTYYISSSTEFFYHHFLSPTWLETQSKHSPQKKSLWKHDRL